jgi:hypothetical protein
MTTHATTIGGQPATVVLAVGGRSGNSDLDTIEQNVVDAAGGLGCWREAAETLIEPRSFHALDWADAATVPAFAGMETAFLQVANGRQGNTILDAVEWSALADGQLQAFEGPRDAQRSLWGHGVAVVNGFLYSIGGSPGLNNPFRVQIDENEISTADGGILGGSSAASTLDRAHGHAPLIRARSHLYLLGGNVRRPQEPELTDTVESIPF